MPFFINFILNNLNLSLNICINSLHIYKIYMIHFPSNLPNFFLKRYCMISFEILSDCNCTNTFLTNNVSLVDICRAIICPNTKIWSFYLGYVKLKILEFASSIMQKNNLATARKIKINMMTLIKNDDFICAEISHGCFIIHNYGAERLICFKWLVVEN